MTEPRPIRPILGIETSCDDTAAAVLAPDGTVLAARIHSQTEHRPFGGVVPEIAARAHIAYLPDLVKSVLRDADLGVEALGAVAASTGPGLIGGLIVGNLYGRGLALARDLPFIAVNHLEAHALTARLPWLRPRIDRFPYTVLLVSGGHTQFLHARGVGDYQRLGGTADDAAGEAFDKVAKLLGLSPANGASLESLAAEGDPARFKLPRPMLGRPGCDLSFSGLKTAVATLLQPHGMAALPRAFAADLAASFQAAVADVVADRARHALQAAAASGFVAAGGVAANQLLRARLRAVADQFGLPFIAPPLALCADNAVMVAWAGIERLRLGARSQMAMLPRPRWPLDSADMKLGGAEAVIDPAGLIP
jgi:N6-L-threonylcarbamoyladenine synthase